MFTAASPSRAHSALDLLALELSGECASVAREREARLFNPVLASVIRLTRERDADALAVSVLETIVSLTTADWIRMHEVTDAQRGQLEQSIELRFFESDDVPGGVQKQWDLEPRPSLGDDSLGECMHAAVPMVERVSGTSSDEEGTRHLFPILSAGQALGVLEIRVAVELSAAECSLVQGFLAVFGNYLALLDEGARDKLTGLFNRRTFEEKLTRLLKLQRERRRPVSNTSENPRRQEPGPDTRAWLGILDLDHFKRINDTYGHAYGDEVLLTVAQKLRASFRKTDLLFRFGGEEFVVILEPIPAEMAFHVFERFRISLAEHLFHEIGTVTASVGFAAIAPMDYPPAILERADRALYYAKDHGRNCTFQYEVLVARGALSPQHRIGSIDLF